MCADDLIKWPHIVKRSRALHTEEILRIQEQPVDCLLPLLLGNRQELFTVWALAASTSRSFSSAAAADGAPGAGDALPPPAPAPEPPLRPLQLAPLHHQLLLEVNVTSREESLSFTCEKSSVRNKALSCPQCLTPLSLAFCRWGNP